MEQLDEIKALQLNALAREQLSDLSVACRHLRKSRNSEAKPILGKLLSQSLPPPVRSIVDSLNKAASGYLHIIAVEDESVHTQGRTLSVPGNKFKVKQVRNYKNNFVVVEPLKQLYCRLFELFVKVATYN